MAKRTNGESEKTMRKIAIYGKGGIGKSTTVANLAVVLAQKGYKVMVIGCDPKADSTKLLLGGKRFKTVLQALEEKEDELTLKDVVHEGYGGVLCVESGGPTPGLGCAGRGVVTALEHLEELKAYEIYRPDIVFYDVLGDVVCGGFTMPIRRGFAEEVYVISSAEMMALYAADNIAQAIKNFGSRGYAKLRGLIHISRNIDREDEIVAQAAREIGTRVIGKLARSKTVQDADQQQKTVCEAFPDSQMVKEYRAIASVLLKL